jgi:O-Antigen ligase
MVKTLGPPLVLVAIVVAAIGLRVGGVLQFVYPAAAVLVGMWLCRTSLRHYVSFVLWLWMLTPLVRRLADWQGGWRDPSLILLAPYLVTAWPAALRLGRSALALAEIARVPSRRIAAPAGSLVFALAGAAIALGIPFGVMGSTSAAVMALLNWLVPLAFGWFIATTDRPDEIERAAVSTFRAAALVVGAYGVWQFLGPQPWDAEWMRNSEMTTLGRPEPFEVRVFSTMHSPGVLGFFLMVPLVLWLAHPTIRSVPMASVAAISLVLSQVRTAWLGLAVSTLFLLAALPHRIRFRVVALGGIAALIVMPFFFSPEVAEMAATRFASLTTPDSDTSALSRLEGHLLAFDFVGSHPFGGGLGATDPRVDQVMSINDSVIAAVLVQFGVVGAFLYLGGLVLVLAQLWRYYREAPTLESMGLAAAGLGLLSTAALGAVTAGAAGVLFWLASGLAVARNRAPAMAPEPTPTLRLATHRDATWRLAGS